QLHPVLLSFCIHFYRLLIFFFFFLLMIRPPPRSTLLPTRRSSDLRLSSERISSNRRVGNTIASPSARNTRGTLPNALAALSMSALTSFGFRARNFFWG